MIEDDRAKDVGPAARAAAFDVQPVRRRRNLAGRLAAGAAIVLVAFGAGLVIASPGEAPAERTAVVAGDSDPSSSPAGPTAADDTAPGTRRPFALPSLAPSVAVQAGVPSTAAPGSSSFVAAFEPAAIVAQVDTGQACEAGAPLEKGAPRTRADGPRLTFQRSWLVFCRIPAADRQAFLVDLFQAMRPSIPAETYAYGTTGDGAGNALFPYADRPMAGTVAVHADAAGDGLAIVVVVEEWRTG